MKSLIKKMLAISILSIATCTFAITPITQTTETPKALYVTYYLNNSMYINVYSIALNGSVGQLIQSFPFCNNSLFTPITLKFTGQYAYLFCPGSKQLTAYVLVNNGFLSNNPTAVNTGDEYSHVYFYRKMAFIVHADHISVHALGAYGKINPNALYKIGLSNVISITFSANNLYALSQPDAYSNTILTTYSFKTNPLYFNQVNKTSIPFATITSPMQIYNNCLYIFYYGHVITFQINTYGIPSRLNSSSAITTLNTLPNLINTSVPIFLNNNMYATYIPATNQQTQVFAKYPIEFGALKDKPEIINLKNFPAHVSPDGQPTFMVYTPNNILVGLSNGYDLHSIFDYSINDDQINPNPSTVAILPQWSVMLDMKVH
jgi:hypothetical protein